MASKQIHGAMGSTSKTHLQDVLGAPGVKGKRVINISNDGSTDFIQSIISKKQEVKDPFYVLDLGNVVSLMNKWNRSLPNVRPFYAVKCNPEPALLGTLALLGAGFDCASQTEIEAVLSLGVAPDRIVYANPCKAESHIRYAANVGVNLTTFDSREEVEKIRKWHPKCALLLRLKAPDDGGARCPLGPKYGALPEEVTPLLQAAHAARLAVHGVSFHVGSGATHSRAYRGAIASAKSVFDSAMRLGMPRMNVLNIGGGFTVGPQFDDAPVTIKSAIQAYFPNDQGLMLISEPGRFFAETAFTLATNIIGKRVRGDLREYWINDGIYGSMNCLLYDHATITATPLACSSNRANPTCRGMRTYMSTVFGPTCDALDTVLTGYKLPELQVNDWLVWPNMGAYTASAGSNFNGFNTSAISTYLTYSNPS
ncbi:Ornithine/DAP/Arg decarboxylase [Macleaya cordata]|uniref:ornithine decarboxylase n=1 Tax=Macleaya cordata TaxID=56857 RepID=A0A200QZX6_MACCD|nr:Ornithine/DAP/Arg decarboxylase [Macleaya cordata]